MKEEDYQPIAYKKNGSGFVPKQEILQEVTPEFFHYQNYGGIPYWDNDTLQSLIAYRQNNRKEKITRPEHCPCKNDVNGQRLCYVDNAINPYVRQMDSNVSLDNYYLMKSEDGRTFIPDEDEDVNKYSIVGYGFCAYLSVHSTLNGDRVDFETCRQRCGIGTLFNNYYTDRYNLYKAIHSDEYQSLIAKSQDEWEKDLANQELKDLDNAFINQMLEQEKGNIAKSAVLLSLFDGKLDRYVGEDYFLKFLNDKLLPIGESFKETSNVINPISFSDPITDKEWANMAKFQPKMTIPLTNNLRIFLINKRVIPNEVDDRYFLNCILHCHYNKMYQHSESKINFRNFIAYISDKYFDRNYLKTASDDIGVSNMKKHKNKTFHDEMKKIL